MATRRPSFILTLAVVLLLVGGWIVQPVSGQARSFRVEADFVHDAIQGSLVWIEINLIQPEPSYGIGSFDLLLSYDSTAMTLERIENGGYRGEYKWERIAHVTSPAPVCEGCQTTLVRVYGGSVRPPQSSVALATLMLRITTDHSWNCEYLPVRFVWTDCCDNSLVDYSGQRLLTSRTIVARSLDEISMNKLGALPSVHGTPDSCLNSLDEPFPTILPAVHFLHGGVSTICAGILDDRGDLNLNGISYERADHAIFAQYFVDGLVAFPVGPHAIHTSDVSANGVPAELTDFTYFTRVIVGDIERGRPNLSLTDTPATITTSDLGTRLRIDTDYPLGSVWLRFDGFVEVVDVADSVEWLSAFDSATCKTKVLLYTKDVDVVISSGPLIAVKGGGSLSATEGTTYHGRPVPTQFTFPYDKKNSPQLLNATTPIAYEVPTPSHVSLDIHDLAGKQIRSLVDTPMAPGTNHFRWDGTDDLGRRVTSGVYVYRLEAGEHVETKNMMLLK